MRFPIVLMLWALPRLAISQTDSGLAAYREGDYKTAIPRLQAAVASAHSDSTLRAALLSALVYEGHLDAASDAADAAAQDFPNSPEVIAARGEYAYYLGDMIAAQTLFKDALKLRDETARGYYGLSRLYQAASMYRSPFEAVSETCQIGGLSYKNCLMRAVEGKHNIAGDADGLIGADFFSAYVIHIDFQKRQLHLTPQPPREPNPQGYDRVIPPDEQQFVKVFRAGDHLFIPTKLNDKTWGLFLLDTGASISNVDSAFARLFTKVYGNSNMRVHGVSGEVKNVFEADKAVLQFGRYQQRNLGLIAFDLNNDPDHQEFRMSGILGMPVLALFHLTIDYRNGLVNFGYILGEKK